MEGPQCEPRSIPSMSEGPGCSFSSPEDRALAASLQRGEPHAVEQVRRWVRGTARPFRSRIGADLEDLEQEVLISLCGTLQDGSFQGRSSLTTYVKRAVVYRCLNRIRATRTKTFVPAEDVRLEWSGPTPYRETADRDELRRALEVVAAMSEECRELWRLLHEGLSYPEMSSRLGVAAGTLRVRMLRCRRRAHEIWEKRTGTAR